MDKKQITIVVAVIRNSIGEVLLAKRRQPNIPEIDGKWEFAGGGIEFGEDPIVAIKREVREEIGLEVEVIRLLPKIISDDQKFTDKLHLQVLAITYECKIISGEPKPNDPEISEVKFVPLNKVKNYNTFRNIHETVELLITEG